MIFWNSLIRICNARESLYEYGVFLSAYQIMIFFLHVSACTDDVDVDYNRIWSGFLRSWKEWTISPTFQGTKNASSIESMYTKRNNQAKGIRGNKNKKEKRDYRSRIL